MSIRFGRGTILMPSPSLFTIRSVFPLHRDHYGWVNIRGATDKLVIMILYNFTAACGRTRPLLIAKARQPFRQEEAVNSNPVSSKPYRGGRRQYFMFRPKKSKRLFSASSLASLPGAKAGWGWSGRGDDSCGRLLQR